jgi:hypothetical protein
MRPPSVLDRAGVSASKKRLGIEVEGVGMRLPKSEGAKQK